MLRSDVAAFVEALASGAADTPENMAPPEARAMYRQMCEANEPPRGALADVRNLTLPCRDGHEIKLRLYVPEGVGPDAAPVMLYFHGGGWVIGDLETHDSLCAEMARQTAMSLIAADYRLAPEFAFPTAYHDALDAMAWLAASPGEIGHPVDGIVLAGDSAGATLATSCAQAASTTGSADILALASFYAALDMNAAGGSYADFAEGYLLTTEMMEGFLQAYFTSPDDRASSQGSPLLASISGDHPPALLFACEFDPLRDQSRAYAAKLALQGVPVRYRESKGHIHGCMTLRGAIPSSQADLAACLTDLASLIEEGRVAR